MLSNLFVPGVPEGGRETRGRFGLEDRQVDRLIVCQSPGGLVGRRVRADEHVLYTCGSMTGANGAASALVQPPPPPGREQFLLIQEWLASRAADLPLEVRASLLGQLPFLVSWASIQRQFACQLEATLEHLQPNRLVTAALPALQGDLVRSYAASHGLPFEAPGSLLSTLRRRAGRALPVRRALVLLRSRLRAALAPRSGVSRPELIIISLQPNSTRSFLPVARKLRELGQAPHFLLQAADERSMKLVRHAGFALDVIERGSGLADDKWGQAAASGFMAEVGASRGLDELLDRMGLPTWADRASLGRALASSLERNLKASCRQTRCVERSLQRLDPRCALFITNRAMLNELLNARKARTRSVFFLQGIVPDIPPVSTPLDVDLAVVGSAIDIPYTTRCGVPEGALRVTGYPEYDHFGSLTQSGCRERMEALVAELGSKPLVVFMSQYVTEVFPDWARRKNIELLCQAARLLPDVFFVLKLHPLKETLSLALRSQLPPNVVVAPACSADEALRAADVAVTYWSTTALESVLLGTPLVQLNGTGLPDYFDVSGKMGRSTARTATELAEALRRLLTSEAARAAFARDRRTFLDEHRITLDGRAAERAAGEIAKLVLPLGRSE